MTSPALQVGRWFRERSPYWDRCSPRTSVRQSWSERSFSVPSASDCRFFLSSNYVHVGQATKNRRAIFLPRPPLRTCPQPQAERGRRAICATSRAAGEAAVALQAISPWCQLSIFGFKGTSRDAGDPPTNGRIGLVGCSPQKYSGALLITADKRRAAGTGQKPGWSQGLVATLFCTSWM